MRLSHKRNLKLKLNKSKYPTTDKEVVKNDKPKSAKALAKEAAKAAGPKEKKIVAKKDAVKKTSPKKETVKKVAAPKKEAEKKAAPKKAAAPKTEVASNLTPKQQTILDIVTKSKEALAAKDIGVKAGQEEAKASAWATSGLKKLVEENLVAKETDGSKITYKSV